MKIVSWNCHYGLTKEKISQVMKYDADILVVQECKKDDWKEFEHTEYSTECSDWYSDHIEAKDQDGTINDKKDLGIGIFCKKGFTRKPLFDTDKPAKHRYVLPYCITNKKGNSFTLFAVWTKTACCDHPYVGQVHDMLTDSDYACFLNKSVLLIGDFNANKCWDEESKRLNVPSFSDVESKLAANGIRSVYHQYFDCKYGEEKQPTEYWRFTTPFHVDYCFASSDFKIKPENGFVIGDYEEWKQYSDHCPIVVDFDWQ